MNFAKHCILTFATCSLAVLYWSSSTVCAHEFETGHIERSIDVIIRGQKVEVKYSLGLADETIVDWLVREELLTRADENRFRARIAELEKKEDSKSTLDADAESKPEDPAVEKEQTKASVVAEPLEFQTELMALLREKLSDSIREKLVLTANGKQLEAVETLVSNSARHHVAMEITLKAGLPSKAATELSLADGNFLQVDEVTKQSSIEGNAGDASSEVDECLEKFRYFGNIRLACRVKGNAVQVNSNVAPIIARAKVVDLASLTLEERIEAATIRTKIGFASPEAR